jgi:hypothetical protein
MRENPCFEPKASLILATGIPLIEASQVKSRALIQGCNSSKGGAKYETNTRKEQAY